MRTYQHTDVCRKHTAEYDAKCTAEVMIPRLRNRVRNESIFDFIKTPCHIGVLP